jgi:NADH-quinone oxidoreductase subunit N
MLLSVLTIITGNLFALRQQNLKRFLAFSSIAQVGFVLVGITANSGQGLASAVYFILIYVFSNLAAFGVVSMVSSATGKETIADYRGFYRNNKFLGWMLALALFSLAGIPPTAGFFGKFFLIGAGASRGNYLFITIVAINLMLSLYYYLKVVIALFSEPVGDPLEKIATGRMEKSGLMICAAGILALGLIGWIYEYIRSVSGL